MEPSLACVMPAYNEAANVACQLRAIAEQGRPADEILLLNDGSTDATGSILKLAWRLHGTRYIERLAPSGVTTAYNMLVELASASWVIPPSANDVLQPGAFLAWWQALQRWPEARIMVGDIVNCPLDWAPETSWITPAVACDKFRDSGLLHGCSMFMRRDQWLELGGHDHELQWMSDWWMNWQVLTRYGGVYLKHPISKSQFTANSFSGNILKPQRCAQVAQVVKLRFERPENRTLRNLALLNRSFRVDHPVFKEAFRLMGA